MKPLLSCAAVATAVCLTGCSGTPPSNDSRLAVTVNPAQRAAVITEMNTMLRSLNGALAAVHAGDAPALAAAAGPSGMAAAADPALEAILPAQWKEYAERVHGGFDQLAATGRSGAAPALRDSALAQLARLSAGCVACHATYRLDTR